MPGSNRGFIVALVGLTVAICLYWLIGDFSSVSSGIENEAANRAHEYQKDAQSYKQRRCVGLTVTEAEECQRKTDQAARENQRVELDLAAQRMTAWWTQIMGAAALIGMALSAIGVWLIYATFRETRRTANEAMRSANEAEENRKAFIESERGHLKIADLYTALSRGKIEVTIELENGGKAACVVDRISANYAAEGDTPDDVDVWSPRYKTKVTPGTVEKFVICYAGRRALPVVIGGYISYTTLGVSDRRTHFHCRVEKSGGLKSIYRLFRPDDT